MSLQTTNHRPWRIVHSEASLGWGGQEHRVLAEALGFHRRGSRVWLVAPEHSQIYQRADGVGLEVIGQRFDRRVLLPFHIMRMAAWLRRERVQIVNPHSSRDAWLMTIAARMARVPLIIRSRHFDVPIPNQSLSRLIYKEWSHHILTTSPVVTDTLRRTFEMDEGDITTLPTGVDLDRFNPVGPRANLPVPEGIPIIGMITVIRFAKGTQVLAEAVRILRDRGCMVHAVIVGDGPARWVLEKSIKTHGVEHQFTLLGHREDVPEIIRSLDVVAIPSFHEAIPQSGLQALACGIPVVASNVGGIPSIIQDGITGRLVPQQDPSALATAIQETLADPVSTRALCANGLRLIQYEYSLESMLKKLDQLYARHIMPSLGDGDSARPVS